MKAMLASVGIGILAASSAFARIGFTAEQCEATYGKPVKTEPAWCGGIARGYVYSGYYIYTIIPKGKTTVEDVTYYYYSKNQRPINFVSAALLLETNGQQDKAVRGERVGNGYQVRTNAQVVREDAFRANLKKEWLAQHGKEGANH